MSLEKSNQPAEFFDSYESLLALRSMSLAEVNEHVEKGVSKEQLIQLKDVLSLSYADIAGILDLTDRTLYLKKSGEVFNKSVSDRLWSLAYLYAYIYGAFLNREKADRWMRRAFKMFGNKSPLELCKTNVGMLCVKEELKRKAMGIY